MLLATAAVLLSLAVMFLPLSHPRIEPTPEGGPAAAHHHHPAAAIPFLG